MIQIHELKKDFKQGFRGKKVNVLRGFSLEIGAGEVFGFLGPNGAGKTTTIKILMNLIMPSGGTAKISGIDVREVDARKSVGYLPEQPAFYSYLTGGEFLNYCGRLCGMTAAESEKKVEELLDLVNLEKDRNKALGKYSRGMLQRIGIAQALINDPEVLILDEPLSGLDPIGRRQLLSIIHNRKNLGNTIFFSSHILADAQTLCDRIAILHEGSIIAEGNIRDIMDKECPPTDAEIVFQTDENCDIDSLSDCGRVESLLEYTYRLTISEIEKVDSALKIIMESGARIESVNRHRRSLEELFIKKVVS
ncbi:ABC transporter ATP-binding protein [candidate division KSB1 bacterium]